jgi:hypothetical protein
MLTWYNLTLPKKLFEERTMNINFLAGIIGLMLIPSTTTIQYTVTEDKEYITNTPKPTLEVNFDVNPRDYIASVFGENSPMIHVAYCESTHRQFNKDGTVLKGIVNNKDIGIFQINEYYHLETAQKLGIDIYTLEGNVEYAKFLYDTQGLKPWVWSKPCWSKLLSGS